MKRAATIISVFVGILSVLVFQSRILSVVNLATTCITSFNTLYTGPALTQLGFAGTPSTIDRDGHKLAEKQLTSGDMSLPRAIRKVFLAVEQAEGAGARVRRSVGTSQLRNFSPFLMLDHFSVKPGAGFPDQYGLPYPLQSAIAHKRQKRYTNHILAPTAARRPSPTCSKAALTTRTSPAMLGASTRATSSS